MAERTKRRIVQVSELMVPREMAALLRTSIRDVQLKASRGELPAIRFGKRWRFDREAVAAWLQAQRAPAQKPA
jgi:excisionase family DNA binding protein